VLLQGCQRRDGMSSAEVGQTNLVSG
jgi:hypothetical protein